MLYRSNQWRQSLKQFPNRVNDIMSGNGETIFNLILSGEIPSHKIYEDDSVFDDAVNRFRNFFEPFSNHV